MNMREGEEVWPDIKSIIHCINLHGDNLVGAEIGVHLGQSFLTLLQTCPNISKLYGVDPYVPYVDYLKEDGQSYDPMVVDEKEIEYIKLVSYHNQKFSGHKDKIVFYEMDGNAASKKVKDKSLDFIFIDSYCSFEQAKNDIKVWYPKVKDGGIFAGHDWNMPLVRLAVTKFRENENIKSRMSTYDDTWIWYK
jgi:hypothetical protein|tara:strand:+ start:85 stop:660 length:576 start_codon:yes stop_codon:yes gene_type:complete